ncbi:MAG: glucosyl-3-phosphoglycerate synthase [Actinomycetota bacterium]
MLQPEVADWFGSATLQGEGWALEDVIRAKRNQGLRLSICLPALNEASTVGSICRTIRQKFMETAGLIDELVVIDSGSRDETVRLARAEGAVVYEVEKLLGNVSLQPGGGKGEALWRSLAVLTGDIVVWLDSDTQNFAGHFVSRLVAPLVLDSEIVFAKAFYRRPSAGSTEETTEGARVTEVLARPLLQMCFPKLSGFIQPLSGEYAIRKSVAMNLPFFTGYGVDVGLLIDVVRQLGLGRTVQVDLQSRVHRNRDIRSLGRTAHQVMQVILKRAEEVGRVKLESPIPEELTQYAPRPDGAAAPTSFDLTMVERPPMRSHLA